MDARAFYDYLMLARRPLWAALRALPEEALSRPMIDAPGPRCLKDFVAHVPAVEDGWFQGDLLGRPLLGERQGRRDGTPDAYWHHETEPLADLLAYWEAVEAETLAAWPALVAAATAGRRISVNEDRPETLSADEVLWHVMQHEVRHTAQIALLLRLQGHRPPSLDLVFQVAR